MQLVHRYVARSVGSELIFLELADEVLDFSDGGNLGGVFFRDFAVEFLFDGHDQFNGIEGVGTEVINEGGFRDNLCLINTELFDDQISDLLVTVIKSEACSSGGDRSEGTGGSDKGEGNNRLKHDEIYWFVDEWIVNCDYARC